TRNILTVTEKKAATTDVGLSVPNAASLRCPAERKARRTPCEPGPKMATTPRRMSTMAELATATTTPRRSVRSMRRLGGTPPGGNAGVGADDGCINLTPAQAAPSHHPVLDRWLELREWSAPREELELGLLQFTARLQVVDGLVHAWLDWAPLLHRQTVLLVRDELADQLQRNLGALDDADGDGHVDHLDVDGPALQGLGRDVGGVGLARGLLRVWGGVGVGEAM